MLKKVKIPLESDATSPCMMLLWAQLRPVLQRGDKKLSVKQTERKQHRVFLEGNPEKTVPKRRIRPAWPEREST